MKHSIYLLTPNRKVGATSDVIRRVETEQGVKPKNYKVLHENLTLTQASNLEIQEQLTRGLNTDPQTYLEITMKNRNERDINVTKLTIGFKMNIEIFEEWLDDYLSIDMPDGTKLVFDSPIQIEALKSNARISHQPAGYPYRTFIYLDKAIEIAEWNTKEETPATYGEEWSIPKIEQWHKDKGILSKSSLLHQGFKIAEEYGELADAIIKDKGLDKIEDALGDMFVVMVSVAKLAGTDIDTCIQIAWDVIKERDGEMIGGDFRKDEVHP